MIVWLSKEGCPAAQASLLMIAEMEVAESCDTVAVDIDLSSRLQ
jgi:hypothetical protein